jgi:glycosidase
MAHPRSQTTGPSFPAPPGRFWMDKGADGFRADVAGALVKAAHVRGNDQFFTTRGEGTKLSWRKIRRLMDEEYPGSLMVGPSVPERRSPG